MVRGDLDEFAAGLPTTLHLAARVTPVGQQTLRITDLPPDVGNAQVCGMIASRAGLDLQFGVAPDDAGGRPRLPVRDVNDKSQGLDGSTVIDVQLETGPDIDAVAMSIRDLWGVSTTFEVALGRLLPVIVRTWTSDHGGHDLDARLQLIEAAIAGPRGSR